MVLHYTKIGSEKGKTPLYLIHTVPLDSTYFVNSLKDISNPLPIVAVDLPSHGQSDDLDEDELTFRIMADMIDELRKNLGDEKIYLLGHGIGGFIAQEYAINYEENLAGLYLLNTAPNTKYREPMAWNIREKYSKVTKQALEQYKGETSEKSLRVRFTQSLATYFDPVDHDAAKNLMDNAHRVATDAYVHISRKLIPSIDYRMQIRNLDIPVFVITSTNDVWPESSSQLIRNDIIHAKYREIESGHFPMISSPQEFWNIVFSFIE